MARLSYARLDRYRRPNCDECRIYPAVVGNLCVRCDHKRWLAEKAAQEQADMEALQAEYADEADTLATLLAY